MVKFASNDGVETTGHSHPFSSIGNPSSRVTTVSTVEVTTDNLIVCNSASDIVVAMAEATGSNRIRQIANVNSGVVTVTADGTDTINGESEQELSEGDCMDIKDYAIGKWVII